MPPKPTKPVSEIVVPHRATGVDRLLADVGAGVVKVLGRTIRVHWHDESGLIEGKVEKPVIFAVWHNRLALCLSLHRQFLKELGKKRKLAAMVSASKDGAILARVLERFGVQPIRGSSSRRGRQALKEMTSHAKKGYDLAITPDGPRGPCYEAQSGVIWLAQLSGFPIVPVTFNLSSKYTFKSWDRFQAPLPFCRCDVFMAPPIEIPRKISDEERAELLARLQSELDRITKD